MDVEEIKDVNLEHLLTYDSANGIVRLMDRRVLLFDATALGLLRAELIKTLGHTAARTILTRFGYAHGWRTAEVQRAQYPHIYNNLHGGAYIHGLCGLTKSYDFQHTDGTGPEPLFQVKWANSFEVEQHLLYIGKAEEAVCWTLTGFASGYESYKKGREVYFIERECTAKGDATCQMEGRYKEQWGPEYKEQLSFYCLSSVDEKLQELTKKLKKTEHNIASRQRQLGLLEKTDEEQFGVIIRSKAMKQVIDLAKHVARVNAPAIVMGESGTGKERISQIIHSQSNRKAKPFIAVNCGALTESLLESELFGHAKGAFTGADRDRPGIFEEACGGTLFLDEIGEISPGMQVKLLRVLQEKEVRRVGENKVRPVDVRIIAATNRNLADEVAAGRFRCDLYYRLCVIEVMVPALRERPEDILPLAQMFLQQYTKDMSQKVTRFSPQASECLLNYSWPGNVRELQNVVARGVALCRGKYIELDDLPKHIQTMQSISGYSSGSGVKKLEEAERDYIMAVLRASGDNKRLAASQLGISPSTLYRKLTRYL
ncbi:sigma-54-dependent Fis family transcriptional regulator [Geobacter sp. FeAm09]|uniref:sigma-54-dependent Fis family transcriptional regulator n=1 Tax=Geobacter sp. FeAm09 TaxID=2597769 RepID=UPI0011EC5F4E|nr:sigma-54-dependent Fis family transcriptional regulator [Geobacter sp. FeAm09]QEM69921.1 sigma-54-dependent Fis family transcriptional regulator [Geobacter sp. FeAm09]